MRKSIIVFLLTAALAGCAVGPNYHRPTTTVASSPDLCGSARNRRSRSRPAISTPRSTQTEFWGQFNDPVLNSLVERFADRKL